MRTSDHRFGEQPAAAEPLRRFGLADMPPELRDALAPRVSRLGYLGEFFQYAANQPDVLLAFHQFTEVTRAALDDRAAELVALTVAAESGNNYERNQHERLAVRLGLTRDWIAAVEELGSDTSLDDRDQQVQRLVRSLLRDRSDGASRFADLARDNGGAFAVGVVMLVGRYLAHGMVVRALGLDPPVPSIFEDGFSGD